MKLAVELIVTLIFTGLGYMGACMYLKIGNVWPVQKELLSVDSRNKRLYLAAAVLKSVILIILFQTIYGSEDLVHQLKLLVLTDCMVPMAAVDYKCYKIPNPFLLAAFTVRLLFYGIEFWQSVPTAFQTLKSGLAGAVIIGVFFLLILLVFKNSIGMGDIKLFAVMALYQGLWGALNSIFFSLLVSFFLSLGLLLTKKKKRKDTISFGPSILVGTVFAIGLSGI